MLNYWQSHQEYLHFLHEAKIHFDSSQRTRLTSEFASAREKLRILDLDPVMEHLAPFYSSTGRPALNQVQLIRSLVLMLHLGITSLSAWIHRLAADDLLAFLIGVIYGIRFMLQIKQQDKEEYERKKAKDELERKEAELRYQKMLEERR